MKGDGERRGDSTVALESFKVLHALRRRLNLPIRQYYNENIIEVRDHTLIANIRTAAMTSNAPFSTLLSGRVGSYSHIALVFWTTAIFVTWPINAMFPMLTTWQKYLEMAGKYIHSLENVCTHGSWFSSADHDMSWHRSWMSSTIWHVVVLLDALSSIAM